MNPLFLKALKREAVEYTPIWMMRQAGRYLPEYRALREKAGSFLNLCQNPDLACEITLQPLRRFPLDATILFADILLIADAMGLGLQMIESQGPVFKKPVRTHADIQNLPQIDPEKSLPYIYETIRLLKKNLNDTPLIGFAGSPWTVAAYMIEGRGSKEFYFLRSLLYRDPALLHQLLTHLAKATTDYLAAQIKAGADAIMLFDTWGGLLSESHYQSFSLDYIQLIVKKLKEQFPNTPLILYSKNGLSSLEQRAATGVNALGLDWTANIGEARKRVGEKVALQGNLDPTVLYASPAQIQQEVARIMTAFGPNPGHIFNLGHGVPLDVPPENVAVLVDSVHQFRF